MKLLALVIAAFLFRRHPANIFLALIVAALIVAAFVSLVSLFSGNRREGSR